MILPEAFSKNESLRVALLKAKPIMDIAFHAADNAEDLEAQLDEANVLTNAQRHAQRIGIQRYKKRIFDMFRVPLDEPSPLLDSHMGLDPFDKLALDAEQEAAQSEASKPKPPKGK